MTFDHATRRRIAGGTFWLRIVLAAAGLLVVGQVSGQADYPRRAIRIIVPYEAGGGTDKLARVLAQRLQEQLGQPVIVENKAGAATISGPWRSPVRSPTATPF